VQVDIIVWEEKAVREIYASGVSRAGCHAIGSVIGVPPGVLCGFAPLSICPEEFMAHVPKGLQVYFYKRDEGSMTNMAELVSKQLQ